MKIISSRQNPLIMSVAALSESKERNRRGKFIAEGLRACTTLIESGVKLDQLYVREDLIETIDGLAPDHLITMITDPVMQKISQATTNSGFLGVFNIPQTPDLKDLKPGLVMAQITDPGNMGTMIRTCSALNIPSVVIVEGSDPWSPKVVQASAGTIGKVKIFRISWKELLENKGDTPLCALITQSGAKPTSAHKNSFLIVGSEAHGIRSEWLTRCDSLLTIPMPGDTESLNAAVAASIALYLVNS